MMHSRHPSRGRGHADEPFAGIRAGDPGALSLAVYGTSLAIHSLRHGYDEESQLVRWSVEDGEIKVDRFDCRLLLDPSDVSSTCLLSSSTGKAVAVALEDEEKELERIRYWDLRHPCSSLGPHFGGDSIADFDTSSDGVPASGAYAAVGFDYGNSTAITATPATDQHQPSSKNKLFPPPPPPRAFKEVGAQVVSLGSSLRSDEVCHPMSPRQFAIMRRAADFVRRCGPHAETLLSLRLGVDPEFGFLRPQHVQHAFYRGLVDCRGQSFALAERKTRCSQATRVSEEQSVLETLLKTYCHDSEQEDADVDDAEDETQEGEENGLQCHLIEEKRQLAVMERLVQGAARGGHRLLTLVKVRLKDEPLLSFLNPESKHHSKFIVLSERVLGTEGRSPNSRSDADKPLSVPASKECRHGRRRPAGISTAIAPQDIPETLLERPGGDSVEAENLPKKPRLNLRRSRGKHPAGLFRPWSGSVGREDEDALPPELESFGDVTRGTHGDGSVVVGGNKKAERLQKARLMVQQCQARDEAIKRRQQQEAMRRIEEQRLTQIAAISAHKQAFLNASDSD